jgi:fructan beta-fructosidase
MLAEMHRPLLHFSPPSGWMNDPNGLVYINGTYHLFYQHYPDSTVWGPMHWGHATSTNLVHWKHLPIALHPDSLGYIFSGSAVTDVNQTSGLGTDNTFPVVALFTYDKQGYETQGLAYSVDDGQTWIKYDKNPVINNPGEKDFRDPKVFWHPESSSWIMALAVHDRIAFYRSANLIEWEKTSEFGHTYGSHDGVWECPDLFPLPHPETGQTLWVLLVSINPGGPNGGSGTQYFIGNFDGHTFTPIQDSGTTLWLDYGPDNYAGNTWNHAPDNRRIFIGWMSNWLYAQQVPTSTWRSAMTIPRELSLRLTAYGLRLASIPVEEWKKQRQKEMRLQPGEKIKFNGTGEVLLTFDLNTITVPDFGVELFNAKNERLRIGFDRALQRFYIDRSGAGKKHFSDAFARTYFAPRSSTDALLKMHLIIDVASVELFADDGTTCMTAIYFPTEPFDTLSLYPFTSAQGFVSGLFFGLKSAVMETSH